MVLPLTGQIILLREYHGETISCAQSGLRGWGEPCGIDDDYAYIFLGSVLSATKISDTEMRLQLIPHEVFLGNAASQLTVTTNQGACLPQIAVGDEWLFYLQRDDKTHQLLLAYGSPSEPVADAQQDIAILRRLAAMTDSGLIQGTVGREVQDTEDGVGSTTWVPVPNHKIVAKRKSDGVEYSALSDSDGNYEFEPLPTGSYDLSANTEPGLWAEEGPAKVGPKSCTAFQLELHTDGRISGHVKFADGKPFKIYPWVAIVSEDGDRSQSFPVDDNGYFQAKGLEPGRYLVGVGIEAQTGSLEWQSRIYYPGVRTKDEATVIELHTSEKRTNIDFQLPESLRR
jgi:hypothetical protein